MKHRLLSVIALMTMAVGVSAGVGDDITAKYLKNADFSADEPVQTGICTYAKDMSTNGTTLYGMQPVSSWTANSPSDNLFEDNHDGGLDGKASATYAINGAEEIYLGTTGYYAPMTNPSGGDTGTALGIVSVWGLEAQYTQEVTLPAGAYRIIIPTYNSLGGTGEVTENLCGFIAADGTKYLSTKKSWTVDEWVNDTIEFKLEAETAGVISIGYDGPSGSGSMPHLFFYQVILQEGDAGALDQAEIDAAKVDLLAAIEIGEAYGVDTSEAQAVYDNPNATLEQVLAAIEKQKKVNDAGTTDFSAFFIQNPHFTKDDAVDSNIYTYARDMDEQTGNSGVGGWGIAEGGTHRFGSQPLTGWVTYRETNNTWRSKSEGDGELDGRASGIYNVGDSYWMGGSGYLPPATMSDGSTEGKVLGMVTCWSQLVQYTQYVTIPAGKYILSISYYNSGGTSAINKNLIGFIADDGTEYLCTNTTFPVGKWTTESIEFELLDETSGNFSMGYQSANSGSASMPHFFIDGISLIYIGTGINASLLALQAAVRAAEDYTTFNGGQYQESIREQVAEAYEAAEALVSTNSTDDEANTAAANTLNNLLNEAKASVAAYNKFSNFLDGKMTNAIQKYTDNEDLSELVETLEGLEDTYRTAYDDGTYTAEQINEAIGGLDEIVVTAVKGALAKAAAAGGEQNLDISVLFTNADYAESTITGWKNETGTSAFLSRVQTAEVWNQSNFNIYQTLADMPKGAYEISVNAFYRTADNQTNYNEWEAESLNGAAYVYANLNQKLLNNVAPYAVSAADEYHTAGIETSAGDSLWVPNTNDNAHWLFYDQQEANNTVRTALTEDGDLTIGIKGVDLQGNEWTVWGAFTVVFKGQVGIGEALDDQIEVLIAQATDIIDNSQFGGVVKAGEGLENGIDKGRSAQEADAIETKTAAIAGLQEAIAYAKKSQPLVTEITDLVAGYEEKIAEADIISTYEGLDELVETINTAIVDEAFESNEQIEAWKETLPNEWLKFLIGWEDLDAATATDPVDFTLLLQNATFDDSNKNGWTVEAESVQGTDADGCVEFWNSSTFDMYQKFSALRPGFYTVSVSAFYRAGNGENEIEVINTPDSVMTNEMYLYAGADQVKVVQWSDFEYGAIMGATEDNQDEYPGLSATDYNLGTEEEPVTFCAPNTRAQFLTFIENDRFMNTLTFEYKEGQGEIKIGVRKDVAIGSDWAPIDNFQLLYLGTEAPDAVRGIAADTATRTEAIYNLAGQRVSKATKGIYIIGSKKVAIK